MVLTQVIYSGEVLLQDRDQGEMNVAPWWPAGRLDKSLLCCCVLGTFPVLASFLPPPTPTDQHVTSTASRAFPPVSLGEVASSSFSS